MHSIILLALIANFILGTAVFTKTPKSQKSLLFLLFVITVSAWLLVNFLTIVLISPGLLKSTYALGAIMATASLVWVFSFDKLLKAWQIFLIFLPSLALAIFVQLTGHVVEKAAIDAAGKTMVEIGDLFYPFFAYVFLTVGYTIYKIASYIRRFEGEVGQKFRLIGVGLSLFGVSVIFVSVILPIFGIKGYENLDSPFSLFFISFSSYAMIKYRH